MAILYYLADLNEKKVYTLGTISSTVELLPFAMHCVKGHKVCLFGDDIHPWCEDEYDCSPDNIDVGTPWGHAYHYVSEDKLPRESGVIPISKEQLETILREHGGEVVENLVELN